ncbi:MAG: ribosome-associated translation inhibitor RaiA [Eubacteriales bacterium]|nr:ribosome-associated translation inhibitor RaiA [Eubacteriales bacterium]
MIRNIVTRDISLNDKMKEKIMRKSDKFERWLGDDGRMEIKLETEANEVLAEITLQIHRHYYRSEGRDADYLTAFDRATEGMERQIRKHKTQMKRRKKDFDYLKEFFADVANDVEEEESTEPQIKKRKSFAIRAMDVEEATLQMNLLGHEFFLFLNGNTGKVNLLYKRRDGDLGLIEPEY